MLVFLLLMNASGFAIMLLDKNLARRHRRRIPEALLLAFAACFGSPGVLAGMYVCRHNILRSLEKACYINGFHRSDGAYYTTITPFAKEL